MSTLDRGTYGALLGSATITSSGAANDICAMPAQFAIYSAPGGGRVLRIESVNNTTLAANTKDRFSFVFPAALAALMPTGQNFASMLNPVYCTFNINGNAHLALCYWWSALSTLYIQNQIGTLVGGVQTGVIAAGDLGTICYIPRQDLALRSIL